MYNKYIHINTKASKYMMPKITMKILIKIYKIKDRLDLPKMRSIILCLFNYNKTKSLMINIISLKTIMISKDILL